MLLYEEIIKEEFIMKKFVGYAAVGVAGYLIGIYEMKYKVIKAMAETMFKEKIKNEKEKGES